jgi:TolB-like protein/Tfp pilus assembly protein PilF
VVDVPQLLDEVWPNVIVTHGSVYQAIAQLRRILGDESEHPKYIENLPRRGYRLIAPVAPWDVPCGAATASSPASRGFTQATNGSIAAQPQFTSGPLGDNPRYIEGVRGRGCRMPAEVRPLTERQGSPEFIVPPSLKGAKEEENPNVQAGMAATGAATATAPTAAPPTRDGPATRGPLGWICGTLIIVVLLAGFWGIVYYRGASQPAERTSSGADAAIDSLAVLPLENLSGDKEQEYFADGMTDALTTDLAQIASLRVISRTSAMQFKNSKETLPQIGRDLKVDAIVEGTVARGANRVRITAQLIHASSDRHLWARTYERDLKDVLTLQDEVAQDIAEQIRVNLTPKERSRLMRVRPVDPEAHDAYLRGLYWANEATVEGERKALDYYQKAIAKDPTNALAYAGMADSFLGLSLANLWSGGGRIFKETHAKAREAALKALELDPSLAQAHTALATIKFNDDWDWSGAEEESKQAIALNPNDAGAHLEYSAYLVAMGRLDEAMKEIERARELDPFSRFTNWWLGETLYHARRYDDALRHVQRSLEMFPDRTVFYEQIANVYEQKKMFAEAFAAEQQMRTLNHDPTVAVLGEAYNRGGYRGYLLKKVQIMDQANNCGAHEYALLNDAAHAMTCLERTYHERFPGILFLRTAPELDSIRSSPRFRDLVRRIGFPQPSSDKN